MKKNVNSNLELFFGGMIFLFLAIGSLYLILQAMDAQFNTFGGHLTFGRGGASFGHNCYNISDNSNIICDVLPQNQKGVTDKNTPEPIVINNTSNIYFYKPRSEFTNAKKIIDKNTPEPIVVNNTSNIYFYKPRSEPTITFYNDSVEILRIDCEGNIYLDGILYVSNHTNLSNWMRTSYYTSFCR